MKKFLIAFLGLVACIGMSACAPFTMDMAESKMEKAGYTVQVYSVEESQSIFGQPVDGLVSALQASKGLFGDALIAALLNPEMMRRHFMMT